MIAIATKHASFCLCVTLALAACGASKERPAPGAAAQPAATPSSAAAPAPAEEPRAVEPEPAAPPPGVTVEGGRWVWPEPDLGDGSGAPPPGLEGASFMVVYRHTHHAFLDNRGYDTEVFRFRTGADGGIEQCRITRIMPEGEAPAGEIECARSGGRIAVTPGPVIEDSIRMELTAEGLVLVVRGEDLAFTYVPAGAGGLRIERRYGERVYAEIWSRSGDAVTALVEDTFDGGAKGHFEGAWPRPRFYVERPDKEPDGGADVEYSFYDVKGGVKFRAEGVEAIGEVLVVGLDAAFPAGLPLEAVALIDICLGEDTRRMTPLLARLWFGGR